MKEIIAGSITQEIEHLPRKKKTPSLNPSTTKTKKERKDRNK
jgi:hypothetical protein